MHLPPLQHHNPSTGLSPGSARLRLAHHLTQASPPGSARRFTHHLTQASTPGSTSLLLARHLTQASTPGSYALPTTGVNHVRISGDDRYWCCFERLARWQCAAPAVPARAGWIAVPARYARVAWFGVRQPCCRASRAHDPARGGAVPRMVTARTNSCISFSSRPPAGIPLPARIALVWSAAAMLPRQPCSRSGAWRTVPPSWSRGCWMGSCRSSRPSGMHAIPARRRLCCKRFVPAHQRPRPAPDGGGDDAGTRASSPRHGERWQSGLTQRDMWVMHSPGSARRRLAYHLTKEHPPGSARRLAYHLTQASLPLCLCGSSPTTATQQNQHSGKTTIYRLTHLLSYQETLSQSSALPSPTPHSKMNRLYEQTLLLLELPGRLTLMNCLQQYLQIFWLFRDGLTYPAHCYPLVKQIVLVYHD